ncbi:transketolase [Loigolactobacillus iwatensis]|uniref:transketolase n=1 Tax=Loigolactobacillus iwatensis TaxID=1267156 RepID=UPI000F7D94B1|nr:transketolase [Loigolactobacillus iwatensis]
MIKFDEIDELGVNAVRMLSVEMIEAAQSGHPGLPLGAAPLAYTLFTRHLKIDPENPEWFDRDRFVLSAGHGSAMLYSLLHLSGFNLSIADLKQFRQLNSRTPGHPEHGVVPGVDATTGPLGQGIGMAVGMAMAEAHLAAIFNQATKLVDHHTYVICGDGDLMEGVSHEAASLAGHLKLSKLIVLYDSNDVSLDGPADRALTDNVQKRFESYGWHYQQVADGNDLTAIDRAITQAEQQATAPTLIEVKTIIGYGAPKQGTNQVHGSPLGADGIIALRKALNWQEAEFTVPKPVTKRFTETLRQNGAHKRQLWEQQRQRLSPKVAQQFKQAIAQELPANWTNELPTYKLGQSESGRVTSQRMIQAIANKVPTFWGGSADLATSNKTDIAGSNSFTALTPEQRNICFGVREFAEATALNGIALHGGSHIFGGTFFTFSDYMRGAIRLAALQKLPVTYIFTHDSIAVGEDGPTHEPVEQLMSLRAMPNVSVIRPADPNEAVAAWKLALTIHDRPTVLVFTRQDLAVLKGTQQLVSGVSRGGYVLSAQQGTQPEGVLIASGSEVALALTAQQELLKLKHDVAVVSMPSFDRFDQQSRQYQEQVLPGGVRDRLSIEMGATLGWERYVGLDGVSLGIDSFGASGKAAEVISKYGFSTKAITTAYLKMWEQNNFSQIPKREAI